MTPTFLIGAPTVALERTSDGITLASIVQRTRPPDLRQQVGRDLPAFASAPIVQRIEQRTPKPWIEVQFLLGAKAMAGAVVRGTPKPWIEVHFLLGAPGPAVQW